MPMQITELETSQILPPHEVRDRDKLTALISSLEAQGWIGAPLVALRPISAGYSPQAVTGSHRYAAAETLGIDIPVVWLDDLCEEHGVDFHDFWADAQEAELDTEATIIRVLDLLPAEVREHYGLDLH